MSLFARPQRTLEPPSKTLLVDPGIDRPPLPDLRMERAGQEPFVVRGRQRLKYHDRAGQPRGEVPHGTIFPRLSRLIRGAFHASKDRAYDLARRRATPARVATVPLTALEQPLPLAVQSFAALTCRERQDK